MTRSRRSPSIHRPCSHAGAVLVCLLAAVVGLPLTAATAFGGGPTVTVVTPEPPGPPDEPGPPCPDPPCDQDPEPGPEPEPEPEPEPPGCDDGRPPPCNDPPPDPDPEPEPEPEPPTCEEDPDQPRCDDPGNDFRRPRLIEEFPRDGARNVSAFTDVVATFSEDVRGVDEETFTLLRSSTGTEVPAVVFAANDSDRWTLRPDDRLRDGARYTVELEGGRFGISDLAGNTLFDTDWSFTTGGRVDRGDDLRRPRVVNEFPRDGATGVSRFTDVRAHFSEAVRGVTTRTFRLRNARTGDLVAAEVFRTGSANRWVLEPDFRLARATGYVVVLRGGFDGIRDLAGNRLFPTTWSFRTHR
ncbi:MAG: Ig-like domain-containing protein [Actinomycetota bacterium]|nr:Ig-like domain-containing protein [Actinomycetota bacterium]